MTAQILLGADQATLFPHAVRNPAELLQVNQARLMRSETTGKYIIFGSGRKQLRHTESKTLGTGSN